MDIDTYRKTYCQNDKNLPDLKADAPGWDAIDQKLATIYGERKPLAHWGATPHYSIGGPDPIDGISVYIRTEPVPHLHYVSYGMTSLYYDEDAVGGACSKWGFEFTFRLKVTQETMPGHRDEIPTWPFSLMNNLARYVCKSGKWFENGHFMNAEGPIQGESDTNMKGIYFAHDQELGVISTPHGQVEFVQIVGTTEEEVTGLFKKRFLPVALFEKLKNQSSLLITDMERRESLL